MPDPLKNEYSKEFVRKLSDALADVEPAFSADAFVESCLRNWGALELKERMHRIADTLACQLPSYEKALPSLLAVHQQFSGLPHLVFPDFVQRHGVHRWNESIAALETFTTPSSSEFAIRVFLEQDLQRGMKQMNVWSRSPNEHIRRLASEGCRPRLPWARPLKALQHDPAPIWPLLETLKTDSSEYVRRSVANNINDISKDHPEQVLDRLGQWIGISKDTDRLVKHACRTLLKQAEPGAMALFGYQSGQTIALNRLTLIPPTRSTPLETQVTLRLPAPTKLRFDVLLHYRKANGSLSPKVFLVADREMEAGEHPFTFRKSFQDLSTRKHYPGEHRISYRVNGVILHDEPFAFS